MLFSPWACLTGLPWAQTVWFLDSSSPSTTASLSRSHRSWTSETVRSHVLNLKWQRLLSPTQLYPIYTFYFYEYKWECVFLYGMRLYYCREMWEFVYSHVNSCSENSSNKQIAFSVPATSVTADSDYVSSFIGIKCSLLFHYVVTISEVMLKYKHVVWLECNLLCETEHTCYLAVLRVESVKQRQDIVVGERPLVECKESERRHWFFNAILDLHESGWQIRKSTVHYKCICKHEQCH